MDRGERVGGEDKQRRRREESWKEAVPGEPMDWGRKIKGLGIILGAGYWDTESFERRLTCMGRRKTGKILKGKLGEGARVLETA